MDLSFFRFDRSAGPALLPTDLAVLMVGVAARQATSPTARVAAGLVRAVPAAGALPTAPGSFNATVAQVLTAWKHP